MKKSDNSIRVIERTFHLLELLAKADGAMGISRLSESSHMSKSTVYRIIHSLTEGGYVEKTQDNEYTIGPKMFDLVSYHINSLELQAEARPFLLELPRELDLTTHLGILDGTDIPALRKLLHKIRRQGWAIDNEEYELGHRCIGTPIFDYKQSSILIPRNDRSAWWNDSVMIKRFTKKDTTKASFLSA